MGGVAPMSKEDAEKLQKDRLVKDFYKFQSRQQKTDSK